MPRKKSTDSRLNLKSGNPAIDRMFRHCVGLLQKEVKLYQNRDLRNPDNRRQRLYGFFHHSGADNEKGELFLDSHTHRRDLVKNEKKAHSFFHELGHVVEWYMNCEGETEKEKRELEERKETFARFFELCIYSLFTNHQRKLLLSFIPHHYVKRQPLEGKRKPSLPGVKPDGPVRKVA